MGKTAVKVAVGAAIAIAGAAAAFKIMQRAMARKMRRIDLLESRKLYAEEMRMAENAKMPAKFSKKEQPEHKELLRARKIIMKEGKQAEPPYPYNLGL
ncbi:MAG: hypothetical protein N3E51_02800 [Candidatus Micrarchaeota archaeon]|nr:hypothetical protein [Candidatus Micrarchaeota archaeon]